MHDPPPNKYDQLENFTHFIDFLALLTLVNVKRQIACGFKLTDILLFGASETLQMAMLGKQCVEDDPILRPDMKQVVISLSHILLSSVEWEATLAGNSQVFSGLVQGR